MHGCEVENSHTWVACEASLNGDLLKLDEKPITPWFNTEMRFSMLAGGLVLLASLCYLPVYSVIAFHFDAIKRILVLALLLLLAWEGFRTRHERFDGRHHALSLMGLAEGLLLWFMVRWVFSGSIWRETGVLFAWLTPLLAFRVGLELSSSRIRGLSLWVVAAGIVQAALMWLQRLDRWNSLTWSIDAPSARMIGTIGYHNQAADFLAFSVAVLPLGWVTFRDASRPIRTLAGLCGYVAAATMLATIPATGARGPSMGVLLGLTVMLAGILFSCQSRVRSSALVKGLAASVLALFVIVFTKVVVPRLTMLRDLMGPDGGFASRFWMFRIAGRMWSERPLTGWGPGSFAYQYMERLGEALPAARNHRILQQITFAREAHHEGLQALAEFGLIGFGLALVLFVLAIFCFWRYRSHVAAWSGGFLLGYALIQAQLSFLWQTALPGPLMALWIGACLSLCLHNRPAKPNCTSEAKPATPCNALPWQRLRQYVVFGLLVMCMSFYAVDIWGLFRVSNSIEWSNVQEARHPRLPPWAHAHRARLGALLLREGFALEGVRMLESAREGYVDPHLLNNLGAGYAALGEWNKALPSYQAWERSGLSPEDALHNVSIALEQLGRFSEALDALGEQSRLWPRFDPQRAFRFAGLALQSGAPDRAIPILDRYLSEDERLSRAERVQANNLLAAAYMMQGDLDAAETLVQAVLQTDPHNRTAARNIEWIRRHRSR